MRTVRLTIVHVASGIRSSSQRGATAVDAMGAVRAAAANSNEEESRLKEVMEFQFRAPSRPGQASCIRVQQRKRSQFKASYPKNPVQQLERELAYLGAKSAVIQLALPESQIRLDGLPYAKARPFHSGVVLSLQSKHGPLSYPCDTYRFTGRDNLRGIVLALEAKLRAVDRYGVTKTGEQVPGVAATRST